MAVLLGRILLAGIESEVYCEQAPPEYVFTPAPWWFIYNSFLLLSLRSGGTLL